MPTAASPGTPTAPGMARPVPAIRRPPRGVDPQTLGILAADPGPCPGGLEVDEISPRGSLCALVFWARGPGGRAVGMPVRTCPRPGGAAGRTSGTGTPSGSAAASTPTVSVPGPPSAQRGAPAANQAAHRTLRGPRGWGAWGSGHGLSLAAPSRSGCPMACLCLLWVGVPIRARWRQPLTSLPGGSAAST